MNFNFLIDIAFDYLRRFLLPKFATIAPWANFLGLVFNFSEKTVDVYTDGDPNNREQMLKLLEDNAVALASTFTASLVMLIRNPNIRGKLAAVLADAAKQLNPPVATTTTPQPTALS